jgi:hypothetical protein
MAELTMTTLDELSLIRVTAVALCPAVRVAGIS